MKYPQQANLYIPQADQWLPGQEEGGKWLILKRHRVSFEGNDNVLELDMRWWIHITNVLNVIESSLQNG